MESNSQETERPAGRPATINKDAMREALLELTANNRPAPSLRRLRRHLGSGSLTTISRLRDEVAQESLNEDQPTIPGDPVDTACDAHFRSMVSAIKLDVARAAEERIAEIEKHCAQQIESAEQRRDKVLHTRDLLNQRTDKAESILQIREKELQALRDKTDGLIAEVEAQKMAAQKANENGSQLKQQLQHSAEQLSTLKVEFNSSKESLQNQIEGLTQAKNETISKLQSANDDAAGLRTELQESESRVGRLNESISNMKERISDRTETINDLKKLNDQLSQKLEAESTSRQQRESELKRLQEKAESTQLESTQHKADLQAERELHSATKLRLKEMFETKNKEISRLQSICADLIASDGA